MNKYKTHIIGLVLLALSVSLGAQTNLFTLAYSTGAPLGKTGEFIENYSWRGFAIENRYFVERDLSIGFYLGWNVFNQSEDDITVEFENSVLYGNQYKYINTFPILVNMHYHFLREEVVRPYVGTGLGLYSLNQRTEMGLYEDTVKTWLFGFQPEAGIWIDVVSGVNFIFGAKYNYAFGTKKADPLSFLNINAGLTFVY
jgi:hypothetical protein